MLYALAVGARRRWFERHPEARRRLRCPVISVGNLSVGGTGKTPLVAAIAQWLLERGERPAILSRGYGRRDRAEGVVVVSDGSREMAGIDRAGDEPLLLARAVPGAVVAVAEDRYLAGALAERRLGATVHVLDDGFQHVGLARDLDVIITSPGEIAGGTVIPFGRLRESLDAAARADLVVVVGVDAAAARAEAWTLGISQACGARRVLSGPQALTVPVVAIAGIADPEQFFGCLRDAGAMVVRTLSFPDHHRYTSADLQTIDEAVRTSGAETVVTTSKDAVRLQSLETVPFPWSAVPMTLEIASWRTLADSMQAALDRRRERASCPALGTRHVVLDGGRL